MPTETNIWFGKKLINRWVVYGGGGPQVVLRDRQGTDRETGASYYPYGDEISSTANDAEKYATYVRDSFTTLDYADQRYYASSYGRFNTADPLAASAMAGDPTSWNRYSYAGGDPVNRSDPHGLCVMDDQGDFWDNADDVLQDWGIGDCDQNPEWLAWASNAAPGTINYNGAPYYPGGGNSGVSDPDPTPCLSQAFVGSGCTPPGTPILWKRPTKPTTPRCPPQYQAYITAYGTDAIATGLSEANVLALSAIESGWGGGRFALGGNSFFNLETLAPTGWAPGDPLPNTIYVDQVSWMNAQEPFASGPNAGRYALVATYQNASAAFASFAANDGRYFSGVTNAATFGGIAVAHGIYAGRGPGFVTTEQTFQNCLGSQ